MPERWRPHRRVPAIQRGHQMPHGHPLHGGSDPTTGRGASALRNRGPASRHRPGGSTKRRARNPGGPRPRTPRTNRGPPQLHPGAQRTANRPPRPNARIPPVRTRPPQTTFGPTGPSPRPPPSAGRRWRNRPPFPARGPTNPGLLPADGGPVSLPPKPSSTKREPLAVRDRRHPIATPQSTLHPPEPGCPRRCGPGSAAPHTGPRRSPLRAR